MQNYKVLPKRVDVPNVRLSWLSTETLRAVAPTEQDRVLLALESGGGVQRTR